MTIVTEQFVSLAKSAAKGLGYPDLPMVVVPHPFETLDSATIRRIAEEKFNDIIARVTKPKEVVARA